MSLDPRDRAVESMLRSGRPTPPPSAECLDAETLAMWADGGLDASSLARAEAHTADCARCQAIMTVLAQATEATHAAAEASAAPRRGWWPLNVRWLVPLAGAVTAVLVWMIVPSG